MLQLTGFNKVKNIKVVSLLMKETGSYNIMQNRPYETNITTDIVNELTNRVMDSPNRKVNGTTLSGLTSSFLQPTATPESALHIVNGWSERRVRFVLKMRCELMSDSVVMYYIQGYTDFNGVTNRQSVAPDMNFYVNSIIQTRLLTVSTPMGPQTYENAFENSHVLMDDKYSNMRSANNLRLMRPEDVFNNLQINHIPGTTLDSRSMLHREAVLSKRTNGLAANYAASIMDGYSRATSNIDLGSNQQELYSQARRNVIENPATLDPFLSAVSQITSQAVNNKFTYSDLVTIDSNIVNVTNFEATGPTQLANMHQTGMTSQWTGSDRITQIATIISQSVPALMLELLLTNVYLKSSNHGLGGSMDTRIVTAKSFTDGDQTNNYNIFKDRLEQNLISDLTYGGSDSYALILKADLIGDTWISISLNGSAFYDYVTPSFCDSLMVPVVTSNPDTVGNLVNDFEQLTNNIYSTVGESLGHGVTTSDAFSKIASNF